MVCIAAFIILCLISVVVAFLSIFKRDIGRKYWRVFKKAWHCVFKKVRLQKCDTNFKDDVKNTILKKVILTHPKWVKPLSVVIEIASVLIVFITIWSLIIAIKSLLALWVFGTCNVTQPSQCGLGAEACSIDQVEARTIPEKIGQIGSEWAQIFEAIPDRLKTWDVEDYLPDDFKNQDYSALDVMDPGCSVCLQSYRNQKSTDFFDNHKTATFLYAIQDENGNEKFNNSTLFVKLYYAASPEIRAQLLNRLYTGENENHVNYQSYLQSLPDQEAQHELKSWLKDFGLTEKEAKELMTRRKSDEVKNYISQIRAIVEEKIKAKSIPVMIYDGKKHNGLYKID